MLKQQTKLRVRLYARLSKDDGDADKESNSPWKSFGRDISA